LVGRPAARLSTACWRPGRVVPIGNRYLWSAKAKNTALEVVTRNRAHFSRELRRLAFPIWSCLPCYPARFMASPLSAPHAVAADGRKPHAPRSPDRDPVA